MGWEAATIRSFGPSTGRLPDSAHRFVLGSRRGNPEAVLMWSPAAAPGVVARASSHAMEAANRLAPAEASAVLKPAICGEERGMSYALTPWQQPTAESVWGWRLQRWRIGPQVLKWLTVVTKHTQVPVGPDACDSQIRGPLEQFASNSRMSEPLRHAARVALDRLVDGAWEPRLALTHGDLWARNVLLPRDRESRRQASYRFFLIDWGGARASGLPFFDLVRAIRSFSVRGAWARRFVEQHCAILHCDAVDAMSYLVAAIAELGCRLEHMPLENYLESSERNYRYLDLLVGTDGTA